MQLNMTVLKTERVILRPWQPEDFEVFASMCAELEVVRFTTIDSKPMPRAAAWDAFVYQMGHWVVRGFGQFAIVARASGELKLDVLVRGSLRLGRILRFNVPCARSIGDKAMRRKRCRQDWMQTL
jgi:RimJ/RimL family protein N-acetyltransferase